jgi:hypothetical protein
VNSEACNTEDALQLGTGCSKTGTFFEGAWHEGNIGETVATEEVGPSGAGGSAGDSNRRPHTSFGPIYTKARELYWSFAHS